MIFDFRKLFEEKARCGSVRAMVAYWFAERLKGMAKHPDNLAYYRVFKQSRGWKLP